VLLIALINPPRRYWDISRKYSWIDKEGADELIVERRERLGVTPLEVAFMVSVAWGSCGVR